MGFHRRAYSHLYKNGKGRGERRGERERGERDRLGKEKNGMSRSISLVGSSGSSAGCIRSDLKIYKRSAGQQKRVVGFRRCCRPAPTPPPDSILPASFASGLLGLFTLCACRHHSLTNSDPSQVSRCCDSARREASSHANSRQPHSPLTMKGKKAIASKFPTVRISRENKGSRLTPLINLRRG